MQDAPQAEATSSPQAEATSTPHAAATTPTDAGVTADHLQQPEAPTNEVPPHSEPETRYAQGTARTDCTRD